MSSNIPQKRSYHDATATTTDADTTASSASTASNSTSPSLSSSSSDFLEFTPLGSGQEVGRSCHILRYKNKTIMLDCGIHPAYTGIACLPFFDAIDAAEIDIILVTHFHLDHIAALPYFLCHTNFTGKCYMTHPTKSIYKLILQDYIKVTSLSVEDQLYSEDDLLNSMAKITTINYHETITYQGIKFVAYNAGHVLGAAMFSIEIANVSILYTGDYSRKEDRHLMAAEIPDSKPDILIIEATYGVQTLQPIQERERRFTEIVRDIVSVRRGKVLLPSFALGRAQELLLILDEYWEKHKQTLASIPIYFASSLAKKCMAVYQTYINMMNKRIQKQAQISNPFVFKHIRSLRGIEAYEGRSKNTFQHINLVFCTFEAMPIAFSLFMIILIYKLTHQKFYAHTYTHIPVYTIPDI
jgi:cleavage and polyadenylation specificity factor subunit 3